jgi:hypothetical protein
MPKLSAFRFEATVRIQSFMEHDPVHSVRNLPKWPTFLFSFLRPKCEDFLFIRNGIKILPRFQANVIQKRVFSDRAAISDTPVSTACSFLVSYATLQSPCSCPCIGNAEINGSVCKLHRSRARFTVPWCVLWGEEFWRRWIGSWSCDTVHSGRQVPVSFYVSSSGYVAFNSKALVSKNIGRMRKEKRRSAVRCCPGVSLEGLRKTRVNTILDVPAAIRRGTSLNKSPNCLY